MSWIVALKARVEDLAKNPAGHVLLRELREDELAALVRLRAHVPKAGQRIDGKDLSLLASAADKLRVRRGV